MSFKVFIYYCALCGGWGAFLAWVFVAATGLVPGDQDGKSALIGKAAAIAGVLGMFVAAGVGLVDAVLNSVGMQRFVRVMLCGILGMMGGAIGGLLGGSCVSITSAYLLLLPGWVLAGALIGSSIGAFDVIRALTSGENVGAGFKKLLNGIYGGLLGGFLGGLPFTLIFQSGILDSLIPTAKLTVGLVLLGLCIGLMIGLAQIVLKQAWVRVEEGMRGVGRELLLTKDETTIGRAEGSDLLLLADNTIQKLHAKIVLKNNRYLLTHAAEEGETLLNGDPIDKPTPLRAGDLISVGKSVLKFGEREKKRR